MCNVLFSTSENLEMAVAKLEKTLEPLMGPEMPQPEAPSLRDIDPMVNSKVGHQLQEVNSRVNRCAMMLHIIMQRVDA